MLTNLDDPLVRRAPFTNRLVNRMTTLDLSREK